PVARRIQIVRRAVGELGPGPVRDRAELLVRRHVRLHEAERALVKRRVDVLAFAGPLAMIERHHRAERGVQARDVVRELHADARGRTIRIARDVPQSAHRLGDHAEARALAVRARLSESRDAHHHQAGIQTREVCVPEAPLLETAGPEVLDDDVAFGNEPPDDVLAGFRPEVDRYERLVAEEARRVERFPLVALADRADAVAFLRLDLDHLRA